MGTGKFLFPIEYTAEQVKCWSSLFLILHRDEKQNGSNGSLTLQKHQFLQVRVKELYIDI